MSVTVNLTSGTAASVTVVGQTAASVAVSAPAQSLSAAVIGGIGPQGQQGSVGPQGPQGSVGPVGPATTLTIGTVSGGTAASATLTGPAGAQVLSLTLPKGDVGSFSAAQEINTRTASYTLALSDAGKLIAANHASTAITITVPPGSSVAFAVGTHIDIARIGAAAVTIAAGSGVTVNATPGAKLRAQYSSATLIEVASDTWLLVGDLSA